MPEKLSYLFCLNAWQMKMMIDLGHVYTEQEGVVQKALNAHWMI